ncbi:hypothetical protein F0L74_26755 [Chitinophaga agrisoli]|uniref:YdhG-like domain-containing protein n=1 Tax=Chitinophaga agrisoli TaxID=2607653 RepID=A0A5B2VJM8_9BACT|nr:DUF1801 domain-containing protein [Chitinophaga agrisoli]KAA2239793.1 hypothetical protein F0L74_26755 [Chitinophaga agrisoli]
MDNRTKNAKPASIGEYIAGFPPEVQQALEQVRATIRKTVPDAQEAIRYAMPTFIHQGHNLVHFAAFKRHIGFYPAPTGNKSFEAALAGYKTGRGSVQFPLDKPMPLELIVRITEYEIRRWEQKKKI